MKILIYRHSIYNRGGDKMILTYANHLAEIGEDVSIMTNRVETNLHISPKINLLPIPLPTKAGTLFTAATSRFADYDVIIADIVVLANLLSFRNSGKVLYFAQDYDPSYYRREVMRKFIELLYRLAFKVFRIKTVAVSRPLADKLSRLGGQVTVIPNGIDLTEFYPSPSKELREIAGNRKIILVFSRRDFRKGFDIARSALWKVHREHPDLKIFVFSVGDGIEEGEIPFEFKNFGYVSSSELREILSSADLFLYPTRHEGMPLFPLEAAACRTPLVVSQATWIINHLEHAWVSPIEDINHAAEGVVRILTDHELAQRLVENSFKLAKSYNIERSKRLFSEFVRGNFAK